MISGGSTYKDSPPHRDPPDSIVLICSHATADPGSVLDGPNGYCSKDDETFSGFTIQYAAHEIKAEIYNRSIILATEQSPKRL